MSVPSPGTEPEAAAARRSRLVGIKLRALVAEHLPGEMIADPVAFAPGAALLHDGAAWVLLDDHPAQRLGAALAWVLRAGAGELQVIADAGTGVLARRAESFALPISVWHVDERTLWPAVPEPLIPPPSLPEHHRRFEAVIVEAGAEPVEEHGVLAGEVAGLEVCRVVDDAYTGETRLDVGVGVHDREAFAMLHGNEPTPLALARVVEAVRQHRRLDAPQHPLNRLGRERLLRWHVLADPGLVGARTLAAAAPPVPRANLKDPVPCVAVGAGVDGEQVVVVCSVGVDLDLIPYAADAALSTQLADAGRLVVATPARDRLRVTDELAGLLRRPVEFASID